MGSRELPVAMNRLMAVELASEGKTLWTAGGRDSDDPSLAETFFLGVAAAAGKPTVCHRRAA